MDIILKCVYIMIWSTELISQVLLSVANGGTRSPLVVLEKLSDQNFASHVKHVPCTPQHSVTAHTPLHSSSCRERCHKFTNYFVSNIFVSISAKLDVPISTTIYYEWILLILQKELKFEKVIGLNTGFRLLCAGVRSFRNTSCSSSTSCAAAVEEKGKNIEIV